MRRAFLALATAAIALSGCDFEDHDASQPDVIGPVVRVEGLASGCQEGPFCGPGVFKAGAAGYQMLVGYLVPEDAGIPDTAEVTGDADLTLARNASYEQALDEVDPAPDGMRWAGYMSDATNGSPLSTFTAAADFRAPVVDGLARGPFRYRVVNGHRVTQDSDLPVNCIEQFEGEVGGDRASASDHEDEPDAICIAGVVPEGDELAELPVRDLAVLPGAAQSVEAGGTAQVPFTLRYAGPASPEADFAIGAATTLPGVQPLPASATVAPPADSDTPLGVSVAVPAGTAPGDYDVTLTASLPNGQQRTATGRVTVVEALAPISPASPAEITLTEPPFARIIRTVEPRLRGRMLFTGYVVWCPPGLPVNCGGSGRALGGDAAARTARRRGSSVIGKAGLSVPSGGERELRVRLTPRGVRFLRNRRSVKLELAATIRGRAGARVTTRRDVTLTLPGR